MKQKRISQKSLPIQCSNCYYVFDRHASILEDDTLTSGGVSICLKCAQICIFKDDLSLRNITAEELNEMKGKWPEDYLKMMTTASSITAKNRFN